MLLLLLLVLLLLLLLLLLGSGLLVAFTLSQQGPLLS